MSLKPSSTRLRLRRARGGNGGHGKQSQEQVPHPFTPQQKTLDVVTLQRQEQ